VVLIADGVVDLAGHAWRMSDMRPFTGDTREVSLQLGMSTRLKDCVGYAILSQLGDTLVAELVLFSTAAQLCGLCYPVCAIMFKPLRAEDGTTHALDWSVDYVGLVAQPNSDRRIKPIQFGANPEDT
jgi:hypothetical protein